MEHDSYQLWFAVRYVHVASIAILAGGAFMVFMVSALRTPRASGDVLAIAAVYEWVFWITTGVTIATGVSNLGLKGAGLVGTETAWGKALVAKLAGVFLLLMISAIRSEFVVRCQAAAGSGAASEPERVNNVVRTLYGLTAAILLAAAWIGLGLAHGKYPQ
jgi:hypothetical protein